MLYQVGVTVLLFKIALTLTPSEKVDSNKLIGIPPHIELVNVKPRIGYNTTTRNISPNVAVTVYKVAIQTEQLTFTCNSTVPVEWIFQDLDVESTLVKVSKQVRLSLSGVNYEYHSYLWLSVAKRRVGEASKNTDNFQNVTCRMVEHPQTNTSVVFTESFTNEDSITAEIRTNFVFDIPVNCPPSLFFINRKGIKIGKGNNQSSCPLKMTVDLTTATYSCESDNKDYHYNNTNYTYKESSVHNPMVDCNDMMDFCKNVAVNSACMNIKCINFTKGIRLNRALFTTRKSKLIKCSDLDGNILYAHYYSVLEVRNNSNMSLSVIHDPTETLNMSDTLVVSPTRKIQKFYDGQNTEFKCVALSSVFMMGSEISYMNIQGSIVRLHPPGNEIVDVETMENFEKTVVVKINKNMTNIRCRAWFENALGWTDSLFNISSVEDSAMPVIVNHSNRTEFPANESESIFKCQAFGIPTPTIQWFKLVTITVQVSVNGTKVGSDKTKLGTRTVQVNGTKVGSGKINGNIMGNRSISVSELRLNSTTNVTKIICKAVNDFGDDNHTFHIVVDVDADAGHNNAGSDSSAVLYISISIVISTGLLTTGILLYKRWKRQRAKRLTEEEYEDFYRGVKIVNKTDPLNGALLLAYDVAFEVHRNDIVMEETVLGSGQFGIVIQGRYRSTTVAVKTIRHTTDIKYFKALLQELKILQYIGHHPHIVNLLGACTTNIRKMEVLLLLDYCENGNLVKFLRSCRSTFIDFFHQTDEDFSKMPLYVNRNVMKLTTKDLVRMSVQMSEAMSFIADKQILHGDLAARNILVTTDKNIKICDFGLAKQLFEYSVYIQKQECPLPLRWMALEALQDLEFSIQSDCWSFGVTLWEIFSLAELPYPGMNWSFESWRMLKDGFRMEKPEYSNHSIYQIMLECWKNDPSDRPTFVNLTSALRKELDALRDFE